ncbi:MAG: methyl-accepting chemotaxis protein [Azovibrio sp.]|uniref:methyl-accepting chemotaxis protein n=1 Tax=Azovibrio sp. TaxID=1872673 RepID=UPI003C77CD03
MRTVAGKTRGALLAQVALGVATWWVARRLGMSETGALAVAAAAGLLAAGVLAVLLEAVTVRPLLELRGAIEQMYQDGDLTRRVSVRGKGEIAATADSFNKLIGSYQTIIGKVFFNSVEIEKAARQLVVESHRVAAGSSQQFAAAQATTDAMVQLMGNMNEVSQRAHETAHIAQEASALSRDGVKIVTQASQEMERIADSVTQSAEVVQALGERSRAISGIVQTIREIAEQTNLLALNAAIEAARAGEQGRGFAVVADEVKKLAERTSSATGEISQMIGAIQVETASAIHSIQAGTDQARNGALLARQASGSLEAINQGAQDTMQKVDAIASAIEQQSATGSDIAEHIHSIMEQSQANSEAAGQTLKEAEQLDYLAVNLKEIGNVFKLGSAGDAALKLHSKMPGIVQDMAQQVGAALEAAVARRKITLDELFDDQYQPIAGTKPPKFNTRFDALCDQLLPQIQEPLVNQNPEMVYAITCDRRGYVPTHNKRFSQPLTGNEQVDFINNRTKRIFDDPVGRRCGDHEKAFLLQTYRRDTGEIMHDISAPVYVQGRHWGGVRIGYKTDT